MSVMSLVAVVVPRKALKIASVFLKGEKICYEMVLYISFCVQGRIYADEKLTFLKRAWYLKGLRFAKGLVSKSV